MTAAPLAPSIFSKIQHSEGCATVKHTAAALVVALAAIALIGGVLLILAQQGIDLAGINSITQMVDPKWIYLGLGAAGSLLLIDVVFILAQLHAYLSTTFTEKELRNMDVYTFLDGKPELTTQLFPNTYLYTMIPAEPQNNFPPVYLVLVREGESKPKVRGFVSPEGAAGHIARLEERGYQDGQRLFQTSQEYTSGYVQTQSPALFTEVLNASHALEPGEYLTFQDPKLPVWALVVAPEDESDLRVHYFKTEKLLQTALETTYATSSDRGWLNQLVTSGYREHVKTELGESEYWDFNVQNRNRTFYFAAAHTSGGTRVTYFNTPEERKSNMGSPPAWVNARERKTGQDLIPERLIDKIVTQQGDYLIVRNVDSGVGNQDFIFYWEGFTVRYRPILEENLADFRESNRLTNDKDPEKKRYYPSQLGRHLLGEKEKRLRDPGAHFSYLSKNEFAMPEIQETGHPHYPQVAPLVVMLGEVTCVYYFINQEARLDHIQSKRLQNGYLRDLEQQTLVKLGGKAFLDHHKGKAQHLVFSFPHPDGKKVCLITYPDPQPRYVLASTVENEIQKLTPPHCHITPEMRAAVPLSSEEFYHLDKQFVDVANQTFRALREKEYVVKALSSDLYTALYIHHSGGIPPTEVQYFRPQSAELETRLKSLQDARYIRKT